MAFAVTLGQYSQKKKWEPMCPVRNFFKSGSEPGWLSVVLRPERVDLVHVRQLSMRVLGNLRELDHAVITQALQGIV